MTEIVSPGANANASRVVLFDFDGTISLIRAGWMDVMVPMMVELLLETKSGETSEQFRELALDIIGRTTGKETIYQMMELADNITRRGGTAQPPLAYKKMYLDGLWGHIEHRITALRSGQASPDRYLVPGARALLSALHNRGLKMYLASGTDHDSVIEEAKLLQVDSYFAGIYGAQDDLKSFSKGLLVKRIVDSAEFRGDEFLGFGDGYVEIEEVKKVGGVAVGVASHEPDCLVVDDWKRGRLTSVGADFIVPNYLDLDELLDTLFQPKHAFQV